MRSALLVAFTCLCVSTCDAETTQRTTAGPTLRATRSASPSSGQRSPLRKASRSPLTAEPELAVEASSDLVAAGRAAGRRKDTVHVRPSFKWAMLANWMYFLSLGLSIPVLARVISTIVNPDGSPDVSPASSVLGGDVEAIDKLCTFMFVGFLGSLSDVVGRKPMMAYSALGFALTCFLQASTKSSLSLLYVADLVDGVSSCMNTICQAYVADASPPERRAINLGLFQGVSVAGAFIIGIPLSAILSAQYGLRAPLYLASAVGVLNFCIIVLFTPESLPAEERAHAKLDMAAANPFGALRRLFGSTPLLRGSAAAFFLVWLANTCMNSQFGNLVNHLFNWGPQESAPIGVLAGVMFALAPRALVPRLGLRASIVVGALIYTAGLLGTGLARTPLPLVASSLFSSIGCICTVSLVAFIANQADPSERGALLGALETLQEGCEALGHSGYGRLFAYAISDAAPLRLPGAPFVAAAAFMLGALGIFQRTVGSNLAAAHAFF